MNPAGKENDRKEAVRFLLQASKHSPILLVEGSPPLSVKRLCPEPTSVKQQKKKEQKKNKGRRTELPLLH